MWQITRSGHSRGLLGSEPSAVTCLVTATYRPIDLSTYRPSPIAVPHAVGSLDACSAQGRLVARFESFYRRGYACGALSTSTSVTAGRNPSFSDAATIASAAGESAGV